MLDGQSYNAGNKDKNVMFYFKGVKSNTLKRRFSDFVILPQLPFNAEDEQVCFARNTINILQNACHKVYPLFLFSDSLEDLLSLPSTTPEQLEQLKRFLITQCKEIILNEKQYTPTFHFVGHGSPVGIGCPSITPEDFAKKLENTFKKAGLDDLKHRLCHFKFHICNGAYADVSMDMDRSSVLKKVHEESFVGRFYKKMAEMGYKHIEVIGYRGYYQTITSKKSSSLILSDSVCDPTLKISSYNAEYKIANQQCITEANDSCLAFPVQGLGKYEYNSTPSP